MAVNPATQSYAGPGPCDETQIPAGATCQEASMHSRNHYIPCGNQAVAVVRHDKDKRSYYMCAACTSHNVANRGGRVLVGEAPETRRTSAMPVKPATQSLEEKMQKAVSGPAPSLTPGPRPKAPEKEVEVVPDYTELVTSALHRTQLKRLVADSVALAAQEKEIKNLRKPVTDDIKNILATYGISKANCDGARVNFYNVPRTSIDKDLLIAAGVKPSVIAMCTVTTNTPTLRISKGGDDGE